MLFATAIGSSVGAGGLQTTCAFIIVSIYLSTFTTMITPKEEYTKMYHHLYEAFGVGSRSWDEIHCHYSGYMYCEANRLNITGEYLVWKDFVEHAKRFDVLYYCGIDTFLREYEKAVMNRVKLQD